MHLVARILGRLKEGHILVRSLQSRTEFDFFVHYPSHGADEDCNHYEISGEFQPHFGEQDPQESEIKALSMH